MFSQFYTYLGISALYYFPITEYVVNTETPHYICVFSSAHEFAHFNPVMREDEANLFAYKQLSASENFYFRYAAALYAYEVISSALLEIRPELYEELLGRLSLRARADILSHEEYVRKYEDGILYKLSVKFNSKSQGICDKRGALSYSLSATLLTGYILSQ